MQRKKLITVFAFVAIVACGACFLPPPRLAPTSPPPPPRAHLDLRGSRRLLVTVVNASTTHHVDAHMLEQCAADSINRRGERGVPQAVAGGEANGGDAVLSIAIEKENASPEAQQLSWDATAWDFDLTLSAVVRRADGAVAWSEASRVYQGVVTTAKDGDPWSGTSLAARARFYVCDPLAVKMLSGGE